MQAALQATKEDPSFGAARSMLGDAHHSLEQRNKAATFYEKGLELGTHADDAQHTQKWLKSAREKSRA